MPGLQSRIALGVVTLLSVGILSNRFTNAQRSALDTYAITNARIVTVSGGTIDRGTVVIRDGLIAAVGENVVTPADARVIDGNGLTVYPGLIDSHTSLGMPQPSPSPSPTASPGGSAVGVARLQPSPLSAPNSPHPAGLQPEVLAEDFIRPGGDQIEAARKMGITTALSAPTRGIWMGQSALINLAGNTTQEMIVRSPLALHVGFTPLRNGIYPNSLMGVFAVLRQMMLDAGRYRELQQAYARAPRGMRRPDPDRALEALLPALDGALPVVLYADSEREISRALDLAEEFKLRAIIAGGMESWKVAERLRERNVPVLLSLNFPRRTTALLPEADPEPLRILRERVEAPKTAARLVAARVRFAFQSGAMTTSGDFYPNITRAIENGLTREDALRALTRSAAEILGVADRLGSIETGKIANLTVTRGELFTRTPVIAYVFIDGHLVDLKPTTPQTALAADATATGTWTVNVNSGSADLSVTLILQQEGERLRGSIQGALGTGEISNASMGAGGDFRFTFPVTLEGQTTEATFTGKLTGNEMQGAVTFVGRAPGTFTGTRAQPTPGDSAGTNKASELSGTWLLNLLVGLQTFPGTLSLTQQGPTLVGVLQSPFGTTELNGGTVGLSGFHFIARAKVEGKVVEMAIAGSASGDELRGTIRSEIGFARFTGMRQK
ncbi:MAG: amidohydrolase family protein [Pyrinomonadaceae bacterium]